MAQPCSIHTQLLLLLLLFTQDYMAMADHPVPHQQPHFRHQCWRH